jgi:hypothetical protein
MGKVNLTEAPAKWLLMVPTMFRLSYAKLTFRRNSRSTNQIQEKYLD